MIRLICAALALLTIAHAVPPSPAVEPLPLKQIYDDPQFFLPKLSPDGNRIAVVLQKDKKQYLTQLGLANFRPEPLAYLEDVKLDNFWWKGSDFMLLLVENTDGSRDFRSYDLRTKKARNLGDLRGRGSELLHILPDDRDNVLIALKVGAGYDLCRLNIRTDKLTTLEKGVHHLTRWIINQRGEPIAAIGNQDEKDFLLWRSSPGAPWQRRELGPETHPDLRVVSVHADQRRLIAWDFTSDGPARVVALDPATMETEILFAPNSVDPDWVENWGDNITRPCAIVYETDRPRRHFLDQEAHDLQSSVDAALPDFFNEVRSVSNDGLRMVILSRSDRERGTYYLLDRREKRLQMLGTIYEGYEAAKFRASQHIQFKARDGLSLTGRLTLPATRQERPPLVVFAGDNFAGPRSRNLFDLLAQTLATRGFAVVRFDSRGTSGFGQAFLKAGDHQISEGMPNDIEDGVQWLVREGLVDEHRVALFGSQQGGVVAMHALARSKAFSAWINWDTPVRAQDFDYENLTTFPRDRQEAIADLGGKRAAAQYRESINPRALVKRINLPSFHFYSPWKNYSRDIMEGLMQEATMPHVFLKQKDRQDPAKVTAEYVAMLGQLIQFLEQYLAKAPVRSNP